MLCIRLVRNARFFQFVFALESSFGPLILELVVKFTISFQNLGTTLNH